MFRTCDCVSPTKPSTLNSMLRRLRQCLITHRAFWVAMLVLCVVVKPVIVLACEVHESQHALFTGHGHDEADHTGIQPVDEPVPTADQQPWHAVMHQGHCCVHGAAILDAPELVISPVVAFAPGLAVPYSFRLVGLEPMLRPPINA